jgi:glycosyltransferase involved in cell wall biosynthesis
MPKLIRVTTVPLALRTLLAGQMKFMKENGWSVTMVSADGPERNDVINNEGCEHHIIPMTRAITPFRDIVSLWRLYKYFKKVKPDIVHSHTPKAGFLSMLAARFAHVPVRIHTIAGLRFMTTGGFKKKLLIAMEKLTYRSSHYVWVNSFSLKKYVEENKLCPVNKLTIIGNGSTNGIDLNRFNRESLKEEIVSDVKQKIRYDPSLFYFLFVGRLVKDKGIRELVEAFVKFYGDHPVSRLVLLGELESELDPIDKDTLNLLESHPAIIRAGWDQHVEYYFSLANVFVFPSHREGFPNVLLQAGAMGCPVICSEIPGNTDVIQNENTGSLFPVGISEAIQKLMQEAFLSKPKIAKMANNLEIKVRKEFSQIFVHREIEKQYQLYLKKTN